MKRSLALLGLLASVLGCSPSEVSRTEVLLQVQLGPQIKASADRLTVSLSRRDGDAGEEPVEVPFALDGDFKLPATIALLPKDPGANTAFRVEAIAYAGARKLAIARVISQFLQEKTLLLTLELPDVCLDELSCGEDETCVDQSSKARCVSARVDAKSLRTINKAPVPSSDAEVIDFEDAAAQSLDASASEDASGGSARDAAQSSSDATRADADVSDAEVADTAVAQTDAAQTDAAQADAAQADAAGEAGMTCRAEDCLNGADDDCDGHPDCEDPDCTASTMCVPDLPVGVRVAAGQACPSGYAGTRKELHRGLTGGGCGGCSCGAAGPTTCTAQLLAYTSSANCTIGSPALTQTLSTFTCTQNPVFDGTLYGVAVGSISATPGSCPAQGVAQPAAAHWGEDAALCTLVKRGAGCAVGQVCAPRSGAGRICVESQSPSCGANQTAELWYTSYDDTRACNACTCTASGASCAGVTVHYGNDWSCNDAHVLGASQKFCGNAYSPPAGLVGTPVNASCTPSSQLTGSLSARGATNLCCLP